MRFTCPSCSKSYRLSRERLGASGGAKIRCPNCKTLVRVQVGEGDKLIAQLAEGGAAARRPSAAKGAAAGASAQRTATAKAGRAGGAIWHVAVDRQAQGPMTAAAIQELINAGKVNADCLAWKKGLPAWTKLGEVAELQQALNFSPAGAATKPSGGTLKTGAAHASARAAAADNSNAPTVMADVISPGATAKGGQTGGQTGGALPAAKPAAAATRGGKGRGTTRKNKPATTPAAAPAQKAPAKKTATKKTAAKAKAPAKAAVKPSASKDQASASKATKSAAAKSQAGKSKAAKAAKPAAKPPAKPKAAAAGGAAQSMAFFESGEQLMADVEFDLPDPNKHKPTKEEYANLLQEFSVMFRLDKRSKRQKAGIVVVLSLLVVGVIAFGVILYLQGQQRQRLIRDSKTILAVFSLPYQTSETVNLSQEAEQESAEFGEAATKKAQRGTRQSSSLAEKLRSKFRGRRMARSRKIKRRVAKQKTKYKFRVKSAAELGLGNQQVAADAGVNARGETVKKVQVDLRAKPTRAMLSRLCKGAMPDLRACAKAHAGSAPFKARVSVNRDGNVSGVVATLDGKKNSDLSSCAFAKMRRKRVGALTKSASITCAVE